MIKMGWEIPKIIFLKFNTRESVIIENMIFFQGSIAGKISTNKWECDVKANVEAHDVLYLRIYIGYFFLMHIQDAAVKILDIFS